MTVNTELVNLIQQHGLEEHKALLFCAAVELQQYGCLDYLVIESDMITEEDEHLYRIRLCHHDPETNQLKLRTPLFVEYAVDDEVYSEFMEKLASKGVTYTGHVNNKRSFSIYSDKDKKALHKLLRTHDLNIDRLVEVTVDYYKNNEYVKKMEDFLNEIAYAAYQTFRGNKSNMV